MRAVEHMKQVLEDTGLYAMTGSSPAEWELAAFGAGFALLEERFNKILGDLFVDTASEEMLAQWEKLFRPQPSTGGLEDSRDTVRQRFAVHPDGFTPQAVKNMLPGAGVRGLLLEKGTSLVVVLGRLLGVNKEEANQELSQLLPSHLRYLGGAGRLFRKFPPMGRNRVRLVQIWPADTGRFRKQLQRTGGIIWRRPIILNI